MYFLQTMVSALLVSTASAASVKDMLNVGSATFNGEMQHFTVGIRDGIVQLFPRKTNATKNRPGFPLTDSNGKHIYGLTNGSGCSLDFQFADPATPGGYSRGELYIEIAPDVWKLYEPAEHSGPAIDEVLKVANNRMRNMISPQKRFEYAGKFYKLKYFNFRFKDVQNERFPWTTKLGECLEIKEKELAEIKQKEFAELERIRKRNILDRDARRDLAERVRKEMEEEGRRRSEEKEEYQTFEQFEAALKRETAQRLRDMQRWYATLRRLAPISDKVKNSLRISDGNAARAKIISIEELKTAILARFPESKMVRGFATQNGQVVEHDRRGIHPLRPGYPISKEAITEIYQKRMRPRALKWQMGVNQGDHFFCCRDFASVFTAVCKEEQLLAPNCPEQFAIGEVYLRGYFRHVNKPVDIHGHNVSHMINIICDRDAAGKIHVHLFEPQSGKFIEPGSPLNYDNGIIFIVF